MKQLILIMMVYTISTSLFSQTHKMPTEKPEEELKDSESFSCLTVGILNGGGSLIGADFEVLFTEHMGFQVGVGFIGFGAGLNYHFKPSIRSSFMSLQYWNQGIGERFSQNALGLNYVHRGKKWFTCQIGLGIPLSEGPAFPDDIEQPPIMIMYSIGAYFPNR